MDFFKQMFSELTTSESLLALLWLFISGLIGFLTAWFYWKKQYTASQESADAAVKEASELRIRNTELLMNQEEVRKEIAESNLKVMDIEKENQTLREEKGQLYANMVMAQNELEKVQGKNSSKDAKKEEKADDEHQPEPDISFDNVLKASETLRSISVPEVEDAATALENKKSADESQKEAADFIKKALGTKIKSVAAKQKDNLQMIKGVGPFIEGKLNKLGIFTFEQISQMDDEFIDKLTEAIQFFPGRILRDDWVGQAKELMHE